MIFLYDWFLTIDGEMEYFWNRQVTGATILFFVNRYISLASFILTFVDYKPMSDKVRDYSSLL